MKKDTSPNCGHRSTKENAREILGGEYFEPKRGFNYALMRCTDAATTSKGKYGKTFKLNLK